MLEEFERALVAGEPMENTRTRLIRKAEDERTRKIAEIEQDFKFAKLIEFGLAQDRTSPPYAMAKGFLNWYRRKYRKNSEADHMVREFKKDLWLMDHEPKTKKKKGVVADYGNKNGTGESVTGTQRDFDGGSGSNETGIQSPVPESES